MTKLEWFKFSPTEWLSGRISRLPLSHQGEYIRFCSVYWNEECSMTEKDAKLELSKKAYDKLVDYGIINVEDGMISISFLDLQYADVLDKSKKASKAGKKSAEIRKQRRLNSRSTVVQRISTDKDIDKDKDTYRVIGKLDISNDEVAKLEKDYDRETIDLVLDAIENYRHNQKYKSLYLTAKNWLKDKPKKQVESDPLVNHVMKQVR